MIPSWLTELPLPGSLPLGSVQVWLARLDAEGVDLPRLGTLLSSDERDRAQRYLLEPPRRRHVVARTSLRILLGRELHCPPAELEFGYSPQGKPSLRLEANREALQFNVSHSGNVALIALASGRRVGVDVEQIEPGRDLVGIARAFWSSAEVKAIGHLPAGDLERGFYRVWTRKEAVLKAVGQGITAGLTQPDVSNALLDSPGSRPGRVKMGGGEWLVEDLQPVPGYAGAIALESPALSAMTSPPK